MLQARRVGDDDAYRRGTLFGFTLAEIVLLIVFALLLALSALLVAKEQQIEELMKSSEGMVRVPPSDAKLIEAVKDAYRIERRAVPPVDELFRELRLALETRAQVPKGLADARLVEAARKLGELLARGTDKSDGRAEIDRLTRALEPLGTQAPLEGKSPIDLILSELQKMPQARNEAIARERQIADLDRKVGKLEAELAEAGRNNLPPIVRIPTNNSFRLGEATLLPEFRSRLTETIIPDLRKMGDEHDIEVIEVVGHTDELPIANSRSNLDTALLPFLNRRGNEADLVAADNAGLGLARAAAVARVLVADPRLARFRILPLSAGQVVDKDQRISAGTSSGDEPGRRRIEIRMRRLNIETRD